MNEISKELKRILREDVALLDKDKPVALLLSGGVDSTTLLFMLLEEGYTVNAYTFRLKDIMSTDCKIARKTCETFNVNFNEILLDFDDPDVLYEGIKDLRIKYNLVKKTETECSYIMKKAFDDIKEDQIITGHCSDGHFVLSKKGMIHYKHNLELMQKYKIKLFSNKNYGQKDTLNQMVVEYNKVIMMPYTNMEVYDLLFPYTWDELNKPKQKQIIRNIYPDLLQKTNIKTHVNFQLGDSGIADKIRDTLIGSKYNKLNHKNPVGIYNRM